MRTFGEAIRVWAEAPGRRQRLRESTVFQVWNRAVGSVLSQHVQPEYAARGVIHLVCESAGWAQEVAVMKPDVIRSVNTLLGDGVFRDLRIRISTLPGLPKAAEHRPLSWPVGCAPPDWPRNLEPAMVRALERLYRSTRQLG